MSYQEKIEHELLFIRNELSKKLTPQRLRWLTHQERLLELQLKNNY